MILFFDTSALVKLFSNEKGTDAVKKLVTNPSNCINVLDLALIELQSAVHRKYRNNEIPKENLEKIQEAIDGACGAHVDSSRPPHRVRSKGGRGL